MPINRRKPSSRAKTRTKLKTSWLNNAMKSIGAASKESFKSIAPNIYGAGELVSSGAKSIKNSSAALKQLNKSISNSAPVESVKKSLDNAIKDLKSGNLYNPDRAGESMMKNMGFGDDADDFGFDDFDDYSGDGDVNVTFNVVDDDNEDDQASFFANAIGDSAVANVEASKATVEAMVSLSTAGISSMQEGFNSVTDELRNINESILSMVDYQNENTTQFYENAIAAFEKLGASLADDDTYKSAKIGISDIFSAKGEFRADAYKKYIKDNLKRVADDSGIGMLADVLKDPNMLEMMISDPVGGITKGVVAGMVPKLVQGTIKEVDETFRELLPNIGSEIARWVNDPTKSGVQKTIGKLFGLRADRKDNITVDEIDREAVAFDKITRNSINEILPKYARESTAYLKSIAEHFANNGDKDKLLDDAEVFDTQSMRYIKQSDLRKRIAEELQTSITQSFKDSKYGDALLSATGQMTGEESKAYQDTLNQFFARIAKEKNVTARDFDVDNKNSLIHRILGEIDDNGNSKKIIKETTRQLYQKNLGVDSISRAHLQANSDWNERLQYLQDNYDANNLIAAGITSDTSMNDFMEDELGYKTAIKIRNKRKKREERDEKKNDRGNLRQRFANKTGNAEKIAKAAVSSFEDSENWRRNEKEAKGYTKIGDTLFGEDSGESFRDNFGRHAKNAMYSIMKGDTRGAMSEFSGMFTDQIGVMWNGVQENFFRPLGRTLFGEKDSQGYLQDGLFSEAQNKVKDTWKELKSKINGRDFIDSKGERHEGDEKESLLGKTTKVFDDLKVSLQEKIFGKKDKDGKPEKKGVFGNIVETVNQGLLGWKHAIFGESDDPDENEKIDKEKIRKAMIDAAPNALLGAGAGTLFGLMAGGSSGSLLGMMVGGPVGGAVLGLAGGLLSRSEKFKNYLFGEEKENEDGTKERIGGLISAKTQKFFKDQKNTIIGGAAIGAMKGMLFPNSAGLLTSVVGGPMAGAALGAGVGLLKNSQMFQEFLYGNEEKGKTGLIKSFKTIFKGKKAANGEDTKDNKSLLKTLGMGAIGGIGMGITANLIGKVGLMGAMATPGGPIGAAILGTAIGIAAGGNKFSKFLFGEKNEDTGKREGGIAQKMANWMHVEVFSPMKSKLLDFTDDIKFTVKYDVLENIRLPFLAIAEDFGEKVDKMKLKAKDFVDSVGNAMSEKLIKPAGHLMAKMFAPARKLLGKAANVVYNSAKAAATLPFRMAGGILKFTKSRIAKLGKHAADGINFVLGGIAKGAGKLLAGTGALIKAGTKKFFGGLRIARTPGKKLKEWVANKKDATNQSFGSKMYRRMAKLAESPFDQEYYSSIAERKEEAKRLKIERKKRSEMDYNRAKVAQMLGYDVKDLTKETVERAKAAAKAQGKTLGLKNESHMSYDENPLDKPTAELVKGGEKSKDMGVRQLTEAAKTNTYLEEIAAQMGITVEKAEEIYDNLEEQRRQDRETAGIDENGNLKLDDVESAREFFSNGETDTLGGKKDSFREWMDNYSREIDEAGSGKNFLKKKLSGLKGNISDAYKDSYAENLVSSGRNKISKFFKRKGRARAEGGEATENEPLLVGDGGTDPSAAEIFVPKTSGKILSQKNNGIRVIIAGIEQAGGEELKKYTADQFENAIEIYTNNLEKGPTNAGRYSELKAKSDEKESEEENKNLIREAVNSLSGIGEENKKHHNIWETIFSKKGLIGAGLIASLPLIIKFLPKIKDTIGNIGAFVGDIRNKLKAADEEGSRDDGDSAGERIKDNLEDTAQVVKDVGKGRFIKGAKDFILDEGNYDADSDARATLVARGGVAVGKRASKIVKGGKKIINGTKNLVKSFRKNATNTVVDSVAPQTDSLVILRDALFDEAEDEAVDKVVEKIGVKDIIKDTAKTGANKVIGMVDDGVKAIINLLTKKFPNIAESAFTKSIKQILATTKNCIKTGYSKIAGEISKILSTRGTSAFLTAHLDTLVFCTIGALNGGSKAGTARLFNINEEDVDGTMRIISTCMSTALQGTVVGSVIDTVCGLVADISGVDVLNSIAVFLYRCIKGDEAGAQLDQARDEFFDQWRNYRDEKIEDQYKTQQKAGIVSKDVTLEQFQNGIKEGKYKVDYQSFRDYTADQNQTLNYKIGNKLTNAQKGVKNFFKGKTSYRDANGQAYAENGDGTYTVYGKNGNKIGVVDNDVIDTSKMEVTGKHGGIRDLGRNIKSKFTESKDNISAVIDSGKDAISNFSIKGALNGVKNLRGKTRDFATGKAEAISIDIDQENPLKSMIDTFTKGLEVINTPERLVRTGFDSLKDKFTSSSIGKFVVGFGSKTYDAVSNFIKNDDVKEVSYDVEEGNSAKGIIDFIGHALTFVNLPRKLMAMSFHAIGRGLKTVVNGIANFGSNAKTQISDYINGKSDEINLFDNEKHEELTPIFGVVNGITEIAVTPVKLINSIFAKIGEKLSNIKESIGNKIHDLINFFSNKDDEETKEGGSGYGPEKLKTYGGRGKEPEMVNGSAYYSQNDPTWKDQSYISGMANDGATMGDSGCGPTAMAMVATETGRGDISPTDMANFASKSGYRDSTGTNANFIDYAGNSLGLSHTDVRNPSPEFIQQQASLGNPTILNGAGDGAFTPAGHYVVAVGTDDNGDVLVNDPRGKSFSKAYKPEQLAKQTRKAWSFGGSGNTRADRRFARRIKSKTKFGGRGVSGDWLSIVKSVKNLIAAQQPGYDQKRAINITYEGRTMSVRTDCSGFVGACLKYYGAIPENQNVTSSSLMHDGTIGSGFTFGGFPGWEQCNPGDILVKNGHTEIYAGNVNGKNMVYNCGSDKSVNNPDMTPSSYKAYEAVWRPGNAGTGANVANTVTTGVTNAVAGAKETVSKGVDVLGKVTSVVGAFAKKAFTGMLTGNWDFDFSEALGKNEDSGNMGTDATTGVSGDPGVNVDAINVDKNAIGNATYNWFRGHGYSPESTVGIMANLQQESGMNPSRIQSSQHAAGIAQWESFKNQSGRWKQMADYAASRGKNWNDHISQLEFIDRELSGAEGTERTTSSMLNKRGGINAFKSLTNYNTAVKDFEETFERAGKPMMENRYGYAKGFYDTYANNERQAKVNSVGTQTSSPNVQLNLKNTMSAYGNGPKPDKERYVKTDNVYGGRGFEVDHSVETRERQRVYVPQNTNVKNEMINTFDPTDIVNSLNKVIELLTQIGLNTGNLNNLDKLVPQGGGNNIVVTGNGNTESTNTSISAATHKPSTNATLAAKIAKG